MTLISHTSKVMLKILQARLQQFMNRERPDVQTGFRKGRGTRHQSANICCITLKRREFQKKTPTSTLFGMPKPLTVYCHPAYLTYMQSTLCEMLGWMIISWNQDCQKKYQQPQIHI